MVRPKPWRAGVRPARVQAHDHLQKHALGSKAGSTQHGTRRGTPVHGAPLVARPRPWRAWVRPAGSRAHQHLQQKDPRREGRFTAKHHMPPRRLAQRRDAAERRSCTTD
jgi:hypothetical protein